MIYHAMDVHHLLKYYEWADEQLYAAIEMIADEDFVKNHDQPRSIGQLLEHYVNGYDYVWYDNNLLRERIDELARMSRTELMEAWMDSLRRFMEESKKFEGVQTMQVSKDKSVELDRDNYLLMFTDHITYHRGQIVHAMKLLGYPGVNTDYYSVLLE